MSFVAEKLRKGFQTVRQAVNRFVAQRQVPPEISKRQIEEEIPVSWKADSMLWGYVTRYMLKGRSISLISVNEKSLTL
jgi:hypothetical protein